MKRKKTLWILLLVLAVGAVLYMGDLFLGNPISRGIVERHAPRYLQETYPELDLRVDNIYYDWYSGGGYDVRVVCPDSRDTRFELRYNRLGILSWDGYEDTVASGQSTLSRLHTEYGMLVQNAAADAVEDCVCFSSLSTAKEYAGEPAPIFAGIHTQQLERDKTYDVGALGAEYGQIALYLMELPENITVERAAEQLLKLHRVWKEQGIGYVYIDLHISALDPGASGDSLMIPGITPEDLESEDVTARLEALYLAQLKDWSENKKA